MKLPCGKYRTVVVDPPWPMVKVGREVRPNQTAEMDYETMSVEDIGALDIHSILEPDAFVFLWTTQRFLRAGFDILDGWGLKYMLEMVWHKPGGFQIYGRPQFNHESVLVASMGTPQFTDVRDFSCAFNAPRNGHSVKPDAFYATLRRVTPAPRLDMFARRSIDGFEPWGDEAPVVYEPQLAIPWG